MPTSEVDLARLFTAVTKALQANMASLNEADSYNHDHGENMVKNFKLITKAVKEKKDATPSDQLSYASEVLNQKAVTGSARIYSQGLKNASIQLQGQEKIDSGNALSLIQSLLGGQTAAAPAQSSPGDVIGQLMGAVQSGGGAAQPAPAQGTDLLGGLLGGLAGSQTQSPATSTGSDLLGGLLGGLMGTGSAPQMAQPAGQGSDLLGGLMGALMGGGYANGSSQAGQSGQSQGGLDLNTMLSLAAALTQSNQQGGSPINVLINALMSGSQMNNSPHHSQSGQLVATTLVNTLMSMLGGKKR